MPSLELLLPFFVATLAFAVMPGPAILYTAAQTLARGRRGGVMAALGIHLGGFVHVAAAAVGLAAALSHVPQIYSVIKFAGAIYLVWLGIGILRRKSDAVVLPSLRDRNARRAFVESIAVEVLNPKTAMFYIAFLPQFVDIGASLPVWAQLLLLGWIVNIAFSAGDIATIFLTSAVMRRLRSSGLAERILRITSGSLLVGLGAHLAMSRD